MLEKLFGLTMDLSLNVKETLICMLVAVVLGILVGGVYFLVSKKELRSMSFFLSLVILPAVVCLVIMLIGSNVARAFSVAGIFTLVRFRSVPGDGKDISLVFMAMGAGIAAGLGYLTIGLVSIAVLAVVTVLVNMFGNKVLAREYKQLRILIPEDMDYQNVFEDIFATYTKKASLTRIKTTNMGTLYELTYHVLMKNDVNEKKFMDEIRTRNGNLTIILSKQEPKQEKL